MEERDIPFSKTLREWRWEAGMTIDDAAHAATDRLPQGMSVSRETVRRLESNLVEEADANPMNVAALARAYGHYYAETSEVAPMRGEMILALFSQSLD